MDYAHLFARGGGGGSSSGGGGGGLIIFIGYVPMHFVGGILRKKMINSPFWLASQVVGWILCTVFSGVLMFFLGFIGFFMAIGAVLGTGAGLYNWFSKLWRSKKVVEALERSESLDPTWNEQAIRTRVTDVFMSYQRDWSARNWQNMASYMTPSYYKHATLMTIALSQAKRINSVNDPVIDQMEIVDLTDSPEDSDDTVTVGIIAHAKDVLIDELSNTVLFTDTNKFTEFWNFKRQGNEWYLNSIEQSTKADWKTDPNLQGLARENGYFYSADWGWLLIPKRGQLFNAARFGVSDINNHIIGIYKDTYLLQLYTYDPVPDNNGSYLIAQTNIPKEYGDIVVRRKKWTNFLGPKGLTKVSTEWSDFNKKYEVFASSSEGATSFELLHPVFMEKLEALPFEINIEVVDNVVYLYSPQRTEKNSLQNYTSMLWILQEAYKQMKM